MYPTEFFSVGWGAQKRISAKYSKIEFIIFKNFAQKRIRSLYRFFAHEKRAPPTDESNICTTCLVIVKHF